MLWWEEQSSREEWHSWTLRCYWLWPAFSPTAFFLLVGKLIFFAPFIFCHAKTFIFREIKGCQNSKYLKLTTPCRKFHWMDWWQESKGCKLVRLLDALPPLSLPPFLKDIGSHPYYFMWNSCQISCQRWPYFRDKQMCCCIAARYWSHVH